MKREFLYLPSAGCLFESLAWLYCYSCMLPQPHRSFPVHINFKLLIDLPIPDTIAISKSCHPLSTMPCYEGMDTMNFVSSCTHQQRMQLIIKERCIDFVCLKQDFLVTCISCPHVMLWALLTRMSCPFMAHLVIEYMSCSSKSYFCSYIYQVCAASLFFFLLLGNEQSLQKDSQC